MVQLKIHTRKSRKKEKFPEQSLDGESKKTEIDSSLEHTLEEIKKIYSIPQNSDVTVQTLSIGGLDKKAALLFISTISDVKLLSEYVTEPILKNEQDTKSVENIIQLLSLSKVTTMNEVVDGVNNGKSALFVEGEENAYLLDTGKFEGRSVEKADNEVIVKGPKESFNEKASTNVSLIRKKIKSEKLIVETTPVSERFKDDVFILYVKDLANEEMISTIKERLTALKVDSIQNISLLEQYIEDKPASVFPTILYTERPDRAASFLEDGYIVLLMNNSPASLILPATFWSFIHNPEDHYMRFMYGNFIRILRIFALFITIFGSAIYVSITNYHSEMVPTNLLLAISATREMVPFPAILEILLMEIAFELIREAGLRVPSPIGPTIGIVGALILGQAAVQANIVSPIIVIVVALGGLCSFTVSDLSMNFAIRILRFAFIIASGLLGIYGMAALFIAGLSYMVSIKSFGVPYLAPMTPSSSSSNDLIMRNFLKNERFRPGFLRPKDSIKKQRI